MRFWFLLLSFFVCHASIAGLSGSGGDETIFRSGMESPFRLEGEARFLAPLVDAEVVLSVAGVPVANTSTDAEGRFAFDLDLAVESSIVEVRAHGVGSQSHEEYASFIGDASFLRSRMQPDGRLTPSEIPALRLNPHHTALYVAMRDIGESPSTPPEHEFERRSRSFSPHDFWKRGLLIAMLAAGDLELPLGAASSLEAMSTEALALDVQRQSESLSGPCPLHPECAARGRIGDDPDQVPLIPPPLNATIQTYLPIGMARFQDALRIILAPDGTASGEVAWIAGPGPYRELSWTEDDGVVKLTRRDGLDFGVYDGRSQHISCFCTVRTLFIYKTLALRFAEGPGGVLLVGAEWEAERQYPDNPELPTDPALPGPVYVAIPAVLGDVGLPGGFDDPGGSRIVLPRCYDPECEERPPVGNVTIYRSGRSADEPHQFNADGTGTTLRLGDPFTWALHLDGSLQIDYQSGASARFVLAARPTPATGAAVSRFTTPSGETWALDGDLVFVQDGLGFEPATFPGRFETLINAAFPFALLWNGHDLRPGEVPFGFLFAPGGTGTELRGGRPVTWEVDAFGRAVLVRLPQPASPDYPQRRTWEVVAEEGDRYYVLETVEAPDPVDGSLPAEPAFGPTSRLFPYRKR